ncbi:MAG TPA: hypothetical protein VEH27_03830 [Methylomirabilota bacterium]|nr:hypothetical protein [Methylomirabilota bacterium]
MDLTLKIKADGTDAVKELKTVVNQINATEAAAKREEKLAQQLTKWREARARLAKEERKAAFEQLSIEEKLTQMYDRRAKIAERLNRENLSATRREALMLAQARINHQLGGLQSAYAAKQQYSGTPPPIMAGGSGGFFGAAAGSISGAMTGMLARFAPAAMLGVLGMQGMRGSRAIAARAGAAADEAGTLGTDVVTAQLFKGAAQASGADFSELSASFRTLTLNQGKAINGNKELIRAFERLGISASRLRTAKPEELFLQVAQTAQKAGDSTAVWSDIMKTLGWRAYGLKAAFQSGFAGAVQSLREAGAFIDEESVQTLDEATDRLGAAAGVFAGVFAPAVARATDALSKMTAALAAVLAGLKELNVFEGLGLGDAFRPMTLAAKVGTNAARKVLSPGGLAGAAAKVGATYTGLTRQQSSASKLDAFFNDWLADAEATAKLRESNEEKRKALEFDALSNQEKINRLTAEQVKLLEQIRTESDPLKKEQLTERELEIQEKLRGIRKGGGQFELNGLPAVDAMSRIGFVRGGIDPTRAALAKQVTLLQKIVSELQEVKRGLNPTTPTIGTAI